MTARIHSAPILHFLALAALLLSLVCLALAAPAWAAKPVDNDRDGHDSRSDCNDYDPTIYPGAPELCDFLDNDCDGAIDEGGVCDINAHAGLTWNGPGTCQSCHTQAAEEMFGSVHYQWEGDGVEMISGPPRQGKNAGAVNSYCINILGNWTGCSNCHNGLGAEPDSAMTLAQLNNVDCLTCHQVDYKRVKVNGVVEPDLVNMTITMDEAVRTVHRPLRANCLQCHAKGGGGDNFKRGDMALAHAATTDTTFDVHMATTGGNLLCQSCHDATGHRFNGRGSDLRPTENLAELSCSQAGCHVTKLDPAGHATTEVYRHLERVACQTCHIPTFAKDALDTAATEATEMHRDWTAPKLGHTPIHPGNVMVNDVQPVYRFWNGTSWAYNLYEDSVLDPATGRYPTSRPQGAIGDATSKLYPFKYKTARQPYATAQGRLIALDTSIYFATGDVVAATEQGLINMGMSSAEPWTMVETDTFQLITHEVPAATGVLACADCHESGPQMDLTGQLGYRLKGSLSLVCTQCHQEKAPKAYDRMHDRHVTRQGYDCSWCHEFSRPERGLTPPPGS